MPQRSIRLLLQSLVLTCGLATTSDISAQEKRTPVPNEVTQQEALTTARAIFKSEYARAETAAQKSALAKKILEHADGAKENAASHFVLLRLARDIAIQAGDANTAVQTVDAMAADFDVDSVKMKAEILAKLGKAGVSSDEVMRLEGHTDLIWSIALSPDDTVLASASHDGSVRLWNLTSTPPHESQVLKTMGEMGCVVISPDGKKLIAGGREGFYLWQLDNGRAGTSSVFRKHDRAVRLAFSHKTHLLASGSPREGTVRLWDVGGETAELRVEQGGVRSVAFSPDDTLLAVGMGSDTGREYSPSDILLFGIGGNRPEKKAILHGHTTGVPSIEFSPNGKTLASAGSDNRVLLWDVTTGKITGRFEKHTKGLTCVTFSPDGRRALSCGNDKTIRLWDVATQKEIHCFDGHTAPVGQVVFSRDGRFAISGSYDKTIRVWRLPN